MTIINKNGEFKLNASQYNWLTKSISFNDINKKIVEKTNFINSSSDYEKAEEIKNELLKLIEV